MIGGIRCGNPGPNFARVQAMNTEKTVNAPTYSPASDTDKFAPVLVEEPSKTTQGCCTTRVIIVVLTVLFLVLAALGAATYYLYPRKVSFSVQDFNKQLLRLKVTSENYIDVTVNSVHADVAHAGQTVATLQKGNFKIKGRGVTTIDIPVTGIKITDKAIDECIYGTHLPLEVRVTVDLKMLQWTGKKLTHTVHQSIACSALVSQRLTTSQRDMAQRYPTMAKQIIKERL